MCWQQQALTAVQQDSKPQGSRGAEPGTGVAPTASLGNWRRAGAGLSLEVPPGPCCCFANRRFCLGHGGGCCAAAWSGST